jgi:hypothetical protein
MSIRDKVYRAAVFYGGEKDCHIKNLKKLGQMPFIFLMLKNNFKP